MMKKTEIEKVRKLSSEIENFVDCYKGCELWGEIEGPVSPEKLLEFLIENPHFQEMANKINKLNK